ncbi:MAG: aldo/keto reductase, partial [Rhizomicrobium sp.]
DGDRLWLAMERLKDEGIFRKIGISAYRKDNPLRLARRFRPDVMQVPFSLLDQRLLADGTLRCLKDLSVEVHVRSLFLQGLFFLERLPPKLRHAARHLARVKAELRSLGIQPLAAALGFVLPRPEIAYGLVGVSSLDQLKEILAVSARPFPALDWPRFALHDDVVLTPPLW